MTCKKLPTHFLLDIGAALGPAAVEKWKNFASIYPLPKFVKPVMLGPKVSAASKILQGASRSLNTAALRHARQLPPHTTLLNILLDDLIRVQLGDYQFIIIIIKIIIMTAMLWVFRVHTMFNL